MLALDERLSRRVGAITVVLLAAAIGVFVFLSSRFRWGERIRVAVYFRHTGGLREGAQVIVAGRAIGSVVTIQSDPRELVVPELVVAAIDAIAVSPLGGELAPDRGGVVVTIAIDADVAVRIPRGGDLFISGTGPLSARHVEFGPAPDPDAPPIADGDHVIGVEPPSLDRVLQRTWDNLMIARAFAAEVVPEFDALRAQLQALARTIDQATGAGPLAIDPLIAEFRRLRDVALGGEPGRNRLVSLLGRARATLDQARHVLDALEPKATALAIGIDTLRRRIGERGPEAAAAVERAIARVRLAIATIDPMLATLEDITARIARGEGSIGKLGGDPEFPEDAKELGKILKRQPWKIFARPQE